MLPMLRQGVDSVVLFPLPEKLKKYDLPLYQRDNGQYVLHRVVKSGASYTCIGDNQFDYETGLRHVQMIALVTAFYRGGQTLAVRQSHLSPLLHPLARQLSVAAFLAQRNRLAQKVFEMKNAFAF